MPNRVRRLTVTKLADNFLVQGRLSHLYNRKKFFPYPLVAKNALFGLGLFEAIGIMASYLRARVFPSPSSITGKMAPHN